MMQTKTNDQKLRVVKSNKKMDGLAPTTNAFTVAPQAAQDMNSAQIGLSRTVNNFNMYNTSNTVGRRSVSNNPSNWASPRQS